MIRLGLCCIFRDAPIKFRTTTATAVKRLTKDEGRRKLAEICAANAVSLMEALQFCAAHGIGSFRINSQILPLRTHPEVGYEVKELPGGKQIIAAFKKCGAFAKSSGIRTVFHPDQFVVLNSPRPEVVDSSIAELEYQAQVAGWVGADVVNIHGGGGYGDKPAALFTLGKNLRRLSKRVRKVLTLENDDKVYTPADLLPFCTEHGIPFVYDVHHHRCTPDGMSEEEATRRALETWDREPLFHISSPIEGWSGPKPSRHHDYIDVKDFPSHWLDLALTIEIEAKAKELAVQQLASELEKMRGWFVYLLRCADGSLYTGISNDVPRRVRQHNAGKASRYTRTRLPAALVHQESQASRSHALKRELAIKALSREEKEAMIEAALRAIAARPE